MRANIVSLIIMVSGPLLAFWLICIRQPSRKKILAGLLAGLFVSVTNFLIEVFAAKYDVYYVWGLWPILNSPLSRNLGWLFLGMVFALGSDYTKAMPHPRFSLLLYILGAIIIGLFTDYLGTAGLEFMALGKNGNWLIIVLIWSSLVPATILVYKILSR